MPLHRSAANNTAAANLSIYVSGADSGDDSTVDSVDEELEAGD